MFKECKNLDEMKKIWPEGQRRFVIRDYKIQYPQFYEYCFNSIEQMEKFIDNRMVLMLIDNDLSLYISYESINN